MEPRRFTWHDLTGTHELVLAWVPGTSGVPYQFGHGDQRRPIELNGFFIGTTPVTQALWTYVMAENPAVRKDPHRPVENVSWNQVAGPNGFLERLNAGDVLSTLSIGDSTLRFRLPSESEWEYAARGGPHWRDNLAFSGSNDPDEVAWYGPSLAASRSSVGGLAWLAGRMAFGEPSAENAAAPYRDPPCREKEAKSAGLYDMSGNGGSGARTSVPMISMPSPAMDGPTSVWGRNGGFAVAAIITGTCTVECGGVMGSIRAPTTAA